MEALTYVDPHIYCRWQEVSSPLGDEKCPAYHCHIITWLLSLTFTVEDMLIKNSNHDRLLYRTIDDNDGYICAKRILIDPGFAQSITPRMLRRFL